METITFVDSGVLIAAATGRDEIAQRAIAVIDDPQRVLASSDFVRLEVLPKPVYHKRKDEVDFYTAFFDEISILVPSSQGLVQRAYEEGVKFGLSAVDALHVAGAVEAKAQEIVTTEKSSGPLCRVTSVRVNSIRSGQSG